MTPYTNLIVHGKMIIPLAVVVSDGSILYVFLKIHSSATSTAIPRPLLAYYRAIAARKILLYVLNR